MDEDAAGVEGCDCIRACSTEGGEDNIAWFREALDHFFTKRNRLFEDVVIAHIFASSVNG